MAEHNDFGRESEEAAVHYLEDLGYNILERNFYWQNAEIDIIAEYNNLLVVVEVKSRKSAYYGEPYSFVNPQKIKLLAKANSTEYHLEHIEDAFFPF